MVKKLEKLKTTLSNKIEKKLEKKVQQSKNNLKKEEQADVDVFFIE